ncbi:MAG TPA: phosphatase PAP2 family protein [Polyangia bacterium]|nr:phosphatase PAP2 family protein [Polyangia bacterium]
MVDTDRTSAGYRWSRGLSLAAIQTAVYFAVGHVHMQRSTTLLLTRWDDMIPLLPWTAWFYLPVYAAIFVVALSGIRSRALFKHAALAIVIVLVVGALGHLLIPAEYPRPVLHPPYPDVSTTFLAAVQGIDPPGNVFPSLHVAQTSLLAFLLCRDRPIIGRVTIVMAAMLALSTLTTKQHFIADVISGYALAFAARAVALRVKT